MSLNELTYYWKFYSRIESVINGHAQYAALSASGWVVGYDKYFKILENFRPQNIHITHIGTQYSFSQLIAHNKINFLIV